MLDIGTGTLTPAIPTSAGAACPLRRGDRAGVRVDRYLVDIHTSRAGGFDDADHVTVLKCVRSVGHYSLLTLISSPWRHITLRHTVRKLNFVEKSMGWLTSVNPSAAKCLIQRTFPRPKCSFGDAGNRNKLLAVDSSGVICRKRHLVFVRQPLEHTGCSLNLES